MPDHLGDADRSNINHLRSVECHAVYRLFLFWERQAGKLQLQLGKLLASDALIDPAQRRAVFEAAYGRGHSSRDGNLLSPAERKLVDDYRAMTDRDRGVARGLFDRLAAVARCEREKGEGA